jgi:hypothetical protein
MGVLADLGTVCPSAWVVETVREEARWAVARQMASELAAETGVTNEDVEWARSALGLDADAAKTLRLRDCGDR